MDINIQIRANANYPILDESNAEVKIKNAQFHAYCKGATEQKKIDEDHFREAKKMLIDKACKWLEERTMFGVHPCSGMGLVMEFRNMFMED